MSRKSQLLNLVGGADLAAITAECYQRYAVKVDCDRFASDVALKTDVGRPHPFAVLEFESTNPGDRGGWTSPAGLRPIS
jgi:hypothetical protein